MQGSPRLKEYRTVAKNSEIEIIISKSRFIGRCFPCADEEQARLKLEEIRKRHWDASHNCYAYSIGINGETARFSDDGEPSGTAGAPMMEAVKRIGATNLLCVVTRYFGGILLGAGGLIRAYSKCCSAAVKEAEPIVMRPCRVHSFELSYPLWARLEDTFKKYGSIEAVEYGATVRIVFKVGFAEETGFLHEIAVKTDASLTGKVIGEDYAPGKEDA
ncbi:MAG: YigZ family protein [Clostridia bacterium]|nr:YigZ family protein [Clostridia bacterium]